MHNVTLSIRDDPITTSNSATQTQGCSQIGQILRTKTKNKRTPNKKFKEKIKNRTTLC